MGNNKSKLKDTLTTSSTNSYSQLNIPESRNSDEERKLKYHLSNQDDCDMDRHHSNHFFRRYIFQSNFSVPIEEKLIRGGCKVLDVGCGPGTWLLDLANTYENSYFFGIDIKPVYPNEIKPGNLEFREADLFNGLPFSDNEFDFVHQESMSLIIETDQWSYVISELIRVTKPGGFIEFVEYISPDKNGPIIDKMYETHKELCSQRGIDINIVIDLDKIIELQPNINKVYRDERRFIIGPNGGKAGMIIQDSVIRFNTSELATKEIIYEQGISKEEYIKMFTVDLKKELKETRPELSVCRFWTQKTV